MSCGTCNSGSVRGVGHFGAYVPGGPRQFVKTTGPVLKAPNASAGMTGLGLDTSSMFNFSPLPTDWITGVPNGFIVVGGLAFVLFSVMK